MEAHPTSDLGPAEIEKHLIEFAEDDYACLQLLLELVHNAAPTTGEQQNLMRLPIVLRSEVVRYKAALLRMMYRHNIAQQFLTENK